MEKSTVCAFSLLLYYLLKEEIDYNKDRYGS